MASEEQQKQHDQQQWSATTLAMHGSYDPQRSMGAVKPPVYATSTFVARTAEELETWFQQAYGLDGGEPRNPSGLIYSRLVNPNTAIYEHRLAAFEQAEAGALFSSGMAALYTTFTTFLRPGDVMVVGEPCYGGTDYLVQHLLPQWGVDVLKFDVREQCDAVERLIEPVKERVKIVFTETPTNPTLQLADLIGIKQVITRVCPHAKFVCDNTVMGPRFLRAHTLGADIVLFSASKSLGGHSDLIAGAAVGSTADIRAIKATRTIIGTINDHWTAHQLTRSLETYTIRVEAAYHKCLKVVKMLDKHPKIARVYYPGWDESDAEQQRRYQTHCSGRGSLLSFLIKSNDDSGGGHAGAYRFINALKCVARAVSLGGTEALVEHPATHTHSDVSPEDRARYDIADNLVRLSVGIEDADDIIRDLQQALDAV